jgi:NAD(P)-dependent dehydrogenase (short-subunit alcohol dehydrogenase family)
MSVPVRPVVLVTGAARRLGRAIALHLARQGWDVGVHYRQSEGEARATAQELADCGARTALLAADLADESACAALVPQAVAALGRVDAVVHNASLFEYDDVASFSYAAMERHWRANTAPAVVLARALHAHLQAQGRHGCLVTLVDQKLWNPNPDYFSYTLSKAALEAANTLLAQALAPRLRVVGVAPGVTLLSGGMTEDEFQASHRLTPLGRSSTPGDIAAAVHFALQSPAITGTTLLVDGGQHLAAQPRDVMFLARQARDPASTPSPRD